MLASKLRAQTTSNQMSKIMQEEKLPTGEFSRRLMSALRKKGWSPLDLSRKTNLSKPTVYRYLNNERRPGCDELYIISKMLGTSMNWLMGDDDDQETVTRWRNRAEEAERKLKQMQAGIQTLGDGIETIGSTLSNLAKILTK